MCNMNVLHLLQKINSRTTIYFTPYNLEVGKSESHSGFRSGFRSVSTSPRPTAPQVSTSNPGDTKRSLQWR